MGQILLMGFGAGVASALLFASVATGSLAATFLFYLAPLPIMIAALGWSHWTALLAVLVAAAGLGAVLGFFFLAAFLAGVGLPAWWLGYLTLLARPAADGSGLDWYPVGRLVMWAALLATLMVVLAVPNFGTDQESFQAGLRSAFERALQRQPRADLPNSADLQRLIDILVAAIPPAAAVLATLVSIVNLWLAARVVKLSGRLQRPWPDLSALALPAATPGVLAAAVACTFLPNLLGILSGVLVAALLMAYAILGFAVLHAATRGLNSRGFILGGAYSAVVFFGWPLLAISMLGLAENAFHIRARVAGRRGPPTTRIT